MTEFYWHHSIPCKQNILYPRAWSKKISSPSRGFKAHKIKSGRQCPRWEDSVRPDSALFPHSSPRLRSLSTFYFPQSNSTTLRTFSTKNATVQMIHTSLDKLPHKGAPLAIQNYLHSTASPLSALLTTRPWPVQSAKGAPLAIQNYLPSTASHLSALLTTRPWRVQSLTIINATVRSNDRFSSNHTRILLDSWRSLSIVTGCISAIYHG